MCSCGSYIVSALDERKWNGSGWREWITRSDATADFLVCTFSLGLSSALASNFSKSTRPRSASLTIALLFEKFECQVMHQEHFLPFRLLNSARKYVYGERLHEKIRNKIVGIEAVGVIQFSCSLLLRIHFICSVTSHPTPASLSQTCSLLIHLYTVEDYRRTAWMAGAPCQFQKRKETINAI